MALAYHCEECKRGFTFEVLFDNPVHWAKTENGPVYCPCCGSYHSLQTGDVPDEGLNCPLPN